MFNSHVGRTALASLAVVMLGSACEAGRGSPATSSVQVSLTDTPIEDADSVVVSVSGVAFKPEDRRQRSSRVFPALHRPVAVPKRQDGDPAAGHADESGRYQWLRLIIDTQPGRQGFVHRDQRT